MTVPESEAGGILQVVATPIGNLEDITQRAVRVLAEAVLIAAEDTRHTGRLLQRLGISRPLLSCRAENESRQAAVIVARLAAGNVALVTDAGTPGISDPGTRVIQAAIAAGHRVEAIPGPSAVLAAVVVSGLPASEFTYIGFPARRPGELGRQLVRLGEEGRTFVLHESPYRIDRLLGLLADLLPERRLAVARELTKLHEEVVRGTPAEVREHFAGRTVKGEITVVVGRPERVRRAG